jgi:hypothetical protein
MAEMQKSHGAGTIIRGADGALYFIRDEILQACKITEPECLSACSDVLASKSGDVQGYALQPNQSVYVQGMLRTPSSSLKGKLGDVASTVMCPWSIGRQGIGQQVIR